MIAILYSILWIAACFKLADRNWKQYYPTLLFSALGNALYEVICYKYQLWQMEPNGFPYAMIPILLLILIGMPLSTWIYLSHFPFKKAILKKLIYISIFTVLFVILEYLSVKTGAITYHHDWNLFWSAVFVIVMFIILPIHHRHPLIALLLSGVLALFLCYIFDVSLDKMK